jgi:hypothetical protein
LGSSPFARHYSGSRGFFPFLRLLRCFSSPACHLLPYGFRQRHARITVRRFPHSDIPGSMDGQLLTRAFRSRPRPSSAPGAKASTVCSCSLDHEEHRVCRYGVFKVRAGVIPPRDAGRGRSLKTQQRRTSRSTYGLGEPEHRTNRLESRDINGSGARGSWSSRIPRKEVIQPQLPLRLPCYDFTPITNPTFDGSVPCGLGHRLRVLPAFVV